MTNSLLIAEASPSSAQQEDEFNEWYSSTHIPEVRGAVPEITKVTRYKVWSPIPDAPARYIATYEAAGISAVAIATKLGAAAPTFSAGPMADSGDQAPVLTFADVEATN